MRIACPAVAVAFGSDWVGEGIHGPQTDIGGDARNVVSNRLLISGFGLRVGAATLAGSANGKSGHGRIPVVQG